MLQQRAVKEWMGGLEKFSLEGVPRVQLRADRARDWVEHFLRAAGRWIGNSTPPYNPAERSDGCQDLFSGAKQSIPKRLHDDGSGNAQHARRKMLSMAEGVRRVHNPNERCTSQCPKTWVTDLMRPQSWDAGL